MSSVTWSFYTAMLLLSVNVKYEHAANIGGAEQNVLKIDTTAQPETTTSRGLLVSGGPVNFTVQAGTRVTLHCSVKLTDENASVSWMKRQDDSLHLISVGTEVFRDDPRLRVVFIKPVDWQLYIQPVNASDQGYYECQVSSHPPIVHSVFLHVVERTIIERDLPMETTEYSEPTTVSNCCENNEVYEESSTTFQPSTEWPDPDPIESKEEHNVPELEIADERDIPIKNKFYNSGSTIELKCKIVKVPHPTQFIIWKHNSTVLNYDTTRGGISVKTDILPDGAKSQLFIANVGPTDSGNYSCSLGEEAVTSVAVVVITGETPAAMQHGSAAMSANFTVLTLLSIFLSALS